jgi:membrane-bound lytic murein transglycosylase B
MRALLAVALFFAGAQAASAASDPCAKFADADAYNNCLAGFGPAAGSHELSRAPPDDVRTGAHGRPAARKAGAQARRPPPRERARSDATGPVSHRVSHGRTRMEIMVPSE